MYHEHVLFRVRSVVNSGRSCMKSAAVVLDNFSTAGASDSEDTTNGHAISKEYLSLLKWSEKRDLSSLVEMKSEDWFSSTIFDQLASTCWYSEDNFCLFIVVGEFKLQFNLDPSGSEFDDCHLEFNYHFVHQEMYRRWFMSQFWMFFK